jgi:hypothetical protein
MWRRRRALPWGSDANQGQPAINLRLDEGSKFGLIHPRGVKCGTGENEYQQCGQRPAFFLLAALVGRRGRSRRFRRRSIWYCLAGCSTFQFCFLQLRKHRVGRKFFRARGYCIYRNRSSRRGLW